MKTAWVKDYTNKTPPKHFGWKKIKFNSPKNKNMFIKFAQKGEAHVQSMKKWTIIMQSLIVTEWKLLELQISQTRNHLSISNEKMSKFKTPPPPHPKWKNIHEMCIK